MIRTVRRFLERYGNKVDALLFVFANPEEQRPYDKVSLAARVGTRFHALQRKKTVSLCNALPTVPFAAAKDFATVFSAEQSRAVQSGAAAARGCRQRVG